MYGEFDRLDQSHCQTLRPATRAEAPAPLLLARSQKALARTARGRRTRARPAAAKGRQKSTPGTSEMQIRVALPPSVQPGQVIQVRAPNGAIIQVRAPPGVPPGACQLSRMWPRQKARGMRDAKGRVAARARTCERTASQ